MTPEDQQPDEPLSEDAPAEGVAEEPAAEAEQPAAEEPVADEPRGEQPVAEEQPAAGQDAPDAEQAPRSKRGPPAASQTGRRGGLRGAARSEKSSRQSGRRESSGRESRQSSGRRAAAGQTRHRAAPSCGPRPRALRPHLRPQGPHGVWAPPRQDRAGRPRYPRLHPARGRPRLEELLESAVANAESNHELLEEDLIVREAYADEGPTIKRFRLVMGRATPIAKRTSHLTIALAIRAEPVATKSKKRKERPRKMEHRFIHRRCAWATSTTGKSNWFNERHFAEYLAEDVRVASTSSTSCHTPGSRKSRSARTPTNPRSTSTRPGWGS